MAESRRRKKKSSLAGPPRRPPSSTPRPAPGHLISPCQPHPPSRPPTAASCGPARKVRVQREGERERWRQKTLAPPPPLNPDSLSLSLSLSPAFRGDAHALAAARTEIRSHYLAAASTAPAEVAARVADSDEAASFLTAHVVQGVLNDRGNYAVTLEAHHADAATLVEPRVAVEEGGKGGGGGGGGKGGRGGQGV